MSQIVGLRSQELKTIPSGMLMVLVKDMAIIKSCNPFMEFSVKYAMDRVYEMNLTEYSKVVDSVNALSKEYFVINEQGIPKLDENGQGTYQEGKNKEDHIKAMEELMKKMIPFQAHKIQPERMTGVMLDTKQSDFEAFRKLMLDEKQ